MPATMQDFAQLRFDLKKDDRSQIRALSIRQPWPHRIFEEGKDIENRDWMTGYRGWFLIHAGKKYDGPHWPEAHSHLPRGGIVGAAKITDCVTGSDSEWFFGDFGFVLDRAFPIPLIECPGKLGFFKIDEQRPMIIEALNQMIRDKL